MFTFGGMGLCPIAPPKGFPIALWKPSVAKYLVFLRKIGFYPDNSFFKPSFSGAEMVFSLPVSEEGVWGLHPQTGFGAVAPRKAHS